MRDTLDASPEKTKTEMDKDFQSLTFDVQYDKDQFKDPAAVGLMLYRLAKERENTNYLFKEIVKKLEAITEALAERSVQNQPMAPGGLSEVDEQLLAFVREQKRVDAEQVRDKFNYKGKNAASARLNLLYKQGLVKKDRAGKRVLYMATNPGY